MGRHNNRAGCSKGHRPRREPQKVRDRGRDKDENGNPPEGFYEAQVDDSEDSPQEYFKRMLDRSQKASK